MHTQQWIINDRPVGGSAPCANELICGQVVVPRQYAYCCPVCGSVWARRVITPSTPWFFWTMCCEKPECMKRNPNRLNIPGTIAQVWDQEFMLNLPLPVLKYETQTMFRNGDINTFINRTI